MARWEKKSEGIVPDWFWEAIEEEATTHTVTVEDCDVAYRTWGSSQNPGVLLIHGMNAHSRWWDFIAPQVKDDYFVVAMDLTGMGDSDYRYAYDADTYSREIVSVSDDAGLDDEMTVVGHSFGGMMAAKAVSLFPERFGSFILVDSGIRHPDEPVPDRVQMGGSRGKVYPDRETAEGRFRLFPPQPCDNEYILKYIAKQSVMRVEGGGYAWKFDEDLPATLKGGERYPEDYQSLKIPTGIIYGANSESFSSQTLQHTLSLIPGNPLVDEISDAQHHVFLDQPIAFTESLKAMIRNLKGV